MSLKDLKIHVPIRFAINKDSYGQWTTSSDLLGFVNAHPSSFFDPVWLSFTSSPSSSPFFLWMPPRRSINSQYFRPPSLFRSLKMVNRRVLNNTWALTFIRSENRQHEPIFPKINFGSCQIPHWPSFPVLLGTWTNNNLLKCSFHKYSQTIAFYVILIPAARNSVSVFCPFGFNILGYSPPAFPDKFDRSGLWVARQQYYSPVTTTGLTGEVLRLSEANGSRRHHERKRGYYLWNRFPTTHKF